jgi:beta-glucosidase
MRARGLCHDSAVKRPAAVLVSLLAGIAGAQSSAPPYLNPDLDFETRARDLVSRMTVDEKVSQLTNAAAEIPRLQVPAYNWWNECLHGVARAGTATVFPQAIGLAATFDVPLMHRMAVATSDEARAKHHDFVRRGQRGIYQGLTFWSPNINIFRDPRWGRGQETYGEDPYLTARMGVAFVKGLQGDDPKYLKVIATAKHYAVHSGPEPDRHTFDAKPSERDLWETYLPAFQALVQEGKVASVMGAYNRVNGESASASQRLLLDILRKDWGFSGYVVSDCGAIDDIYKTHKIVATPEQAGALGVTKGCDLECGTVYRKLGDALKQGLLTEKDLDVAVTRLMFARLKLGMFDPPERVRYARTPYSVNDSPEHGRLARKVAQESIVLLKNSGVLPLRKDLKSLAVIGPNSDELITLLGNYYGAPSRPVTALAGIRAAVSPNTKVAFARGVDLVEGRQDPRAETIIESQHLRGLKGEYFQGRELEGAPVLTRADTRVDFRWFRGAPTDDMVARGEMPSQQALSPDDYSARWTAQLVPPVTGEYEITVAADDGFRLFLDGKPVIDDWTTTPRLRAKTAKVQLAAGQARDLRLEYFESIRDAEIRLAWKLPGARPPFEEAVLVARASDAVIFVGGLNGDVEGEEMRVPYPGFAGGDRTDIVLPGPQQKLLEALHATGKPVVFVLMTGSAVAIDWAQRNLPAIVVAWYPGQEGGHALADVLFGDVSPAGRLPVTFYKSIADLPPFDDYSMANRTYRYFKGEPLYPFGHGLSYSTFMYSSRPLAKPRVRADERFQVSVGVTNTGKQDADEVVQLYVSDVESKLPMPEKTLRGFQRVPLKAGEAKTVTFELQPSADFAYYDETRKAYAVEPGEFELQIGSSSRDIKVRGRVRVDR